MSGQSNGRFAADVRLNADELISWIHDMAAVFPEHLVDVRRAAKAEGLDHPLVAKFSAALIERARRC
jgi:hypothetical protein